jgi:hypothetical protein
MEFAEPDAVEKTVARRNRIRPHQKTNRIRRESPFHAGRLALSRPRDGGDNFQARTPREHVLASM